MRHLFFRIYNQQQKGKSQRFIETIQLNIILVLGKSIVVTCIQL